MKAIFITGTDTNVGKTAVTVALIKQCNAANFKTFAIKPIASGCERDATGKLVNADALALQAIASIKRPYDSVNPIALEEPIAPHLAAKMANVLLTATAIKKQLLASIQPEADINFIEGVGGWMVPLNDQELVADVICSLNIPTILVVGMKLGCLNHAILTSKSIQQMKVPFIGWIANCLEPNTLKIPENINTLKQWIPAPCLGIVPYRFYDDGYEAMFDIKTILVK